MQNSMAQLRGNSLLVANRAICSWIGAVSGNHTTQFLRSCQAFSRTDTTCKSRKERAARSFLSVQLWMDYSKLFKDLYSREGYCMCKPNVQQQGWLYLTHEVSCKQMFEDLLNKLKSAEIEWPPPQTLPLELEDEYTLDGRVPVLEQYFTTERHHRNPEPHRWVSQDIEALVEKARRREEFSYGKKETDYLYSTFDQYAVRGQQGLVLGTETPWLEAILLSNDVKKVTTVEYNEIRSEHSQLKTMTPEALARSWLSNQTDVFDFAVSYSSYEHDGLGRYGDPIDPWGDIWDVRRVGCLVKPQGLFYLGVPVAADQIIWNAHRIYGPLRLPLLTANWEVLGAWAEHGWVKDYQKLWTLPPRAFTQPVIVLKNRRDGPCARS